MLMMRSNQSKLTPPPPVPPRPSKTVVAEALAKSRRISPVRALFATQPVVPQKDVVSSAKPVVPIRTAPPPPTIKPKPGGQVAQPQVVKSYSSAMVFNPKLRSDDTRVVRSVSDCERTVVYQSSNVKTSKIEVNLSRKPSVKGLKRVESTKNERNKETVNVSTPENRHCVKINTSLNTDVTTNDASSVISDVISQEDKNKIAEVLSETIVQSSEKTMIIVTNKADDANNNIFQNDPIPVDSSVCLYDSNEHNSDSSKENDSTESTVERTTRKVQFNDKVNHEILIAELQNMKEEQDRLLKRQRKPPVDIYDIENDESDEKSSRIQHSDWVEVANNGEEVRLSSCQILIDNECLLSRKPSRAPSMSSLHGLPPLPKSLSGFNIVESTRYRIPASPGPQTPNRAGSSRGPTPPTPGQAPVVYPPHPRLNGTAVAVADLPRGRKITTLDTQLAILRREMYGLRQLDLSLLSQLYSLNESIQDFRAILQEQEDSALSPHSPSPSPSSGDEADEFYSPAPLRFKPAPPAPPLRRTSNSSSANSSEYGTV